MLQKQPISVGFGKGLDTKTDPFQVQVGNFLALTNSVFTTGGRLTKRAGFENLTKLPNNIQTTLTTLNDNLIATGSNLYAFSEDTNQWLNQGIVQPVQLNTLPLVRVSTSQSSPDAAVASNGLVCLAYMDGGSSYYQISDSKTGQQIVNRTALPATAVSPRVYILGIYFIVIFLDTVSATPTIQYVAIPTANPTNPRPVATFSSTPASTSAGYDCYVVNNTLYVAWGITGGVSIAFLTSSLTISTSTTVSGASANIMSVFADTVVQRIFISYSDGTNAWSAAFNYSMAQVMAATEIATGVTWNEITSVASNGTCTVFAQITNDYGYDSSIRTDYIAGLTVTLPVSGTGVGTFSSLTFPTAATPIVAPGTSPTPVVRSVGLGSKAFYGSSGTVYMLAEYGDTRQSNPLTDTNQATYFLIDETGSVYMRLAYSNGGGYAANQVLPNVTDLDSTYYVPYLTADFLTTVNKGTNLPSGTPVNAIYTQYGVNLAAFGLNITHQYSSEIAGALHLTGGQLWEYDGVKPVEFGFQVWPENVEGTTSGSGGSIGAGTYYYQFTYEWTDNQGNLHRSAPSIPIVITTTGSTSENTINVPTDRLTYKIQPNPIRIVGYRWSVAQQVYYQFTSVTNPHINDPTVDYITITDTLADASILGNAIIYTTGGVVEDIAPPASIASALFNNRLFLVDAEDQNLLWFSKQVIEAVPVEMSDLLTLYIAPTSGAQGSTGPITALSAMDDKLIIFKRDAIYYITGAGPDNTGSNSDFSSPIFITSSVGCANPNSIVLMPQGLMFQSDKGIWLLGRDLSTSYIGAGVEEFNTSTILSAQSIPGTNQVRFIAGNNTTLMYDYYYQQWGTHTNIAAISGTLYQGAQTYLNSYGQVFQEVSGQYLDGSEPVLMSFTTSWMNIAGLQGFQRFYFLYLLGTYVTPFKLNVQLAYNYNSSALQNILITPNNFSPDWGDLPQWGSSPAWGGGDGDGSSADTSANVFAVRLFPQQQKCDAVQISVNEVYDPTFGVAAGEGLTLSGMNFVIGVKKGYRTQRASNSFG